MNKELQAHGLVLMATFLVAGSFIVSAKLSGIVHPLSITLLRFIVACITLAPLILAHQNCIQKIRATSMRAMVISFFYALFFIGMFSSLEYTTALNTGTIFTLLPLITGLLSIIVFKQHLTWQQCGVYAIGIMGTSMVIVKGSIDLLVGVSLNKGDIIFLGSIIFMALYSISSKYLYKKEDTLIVLVFMTLFGGCVWLGLGLVLLDIPLQWYKIDSTQWVYLAYLSIAATLVTAYLYQKSTVILGPKKTMSYVYLNPASIALLLFIFEKTTINIGMFMGIVLSSFATLVLLVKS